MSKGWDLAHLGDAVARVQELRVSLGSAELELARRIEAFGTAADKALDLVSALLGDRLWWPATASNFTDTDLALSVVTGPVLLRAAGTLSVGQPAPAPPEIVQAPVEEPPAETAAPVAVVEQPKPVPDEVVQSAAAAPIDGPDETEAAATIAATGEAEPGWLSCKQYAELCGVSEARVYNAIASGLIDGPAVRHGPPKRVLASLADAQILQRSPPGLLRGNVAKRVETPVTVLESVPAETGMTAPAAVRLLRGFGSTVIELGGAEYTVDGVLLTAVDVIEKAASIQARNQRLAQARRQGRGG